MKNIYDKHICVTDEVKKNIEDMKVVLPANYSKLYSEAADKHALELKPEELLTSEMLDEKMVQHIVTLCSCTDNALDAMETNNHSKLQKVIEETHKLRIDIEELTKVIYEDSLTKSYNRKWLEDQLLDKEKIKTIKNGILALVDLNKFKSINDTYGHVIGDKVLIHVATKLKETGGNVVRYGGDEFIVEFDAHETIESVKKKIATMVQGCEKKSFVVEGDSFKVSFSYGIASFENGSEFNHVLNEADKAMYEYKKVKS